MKLDERTEKVVAVYSKYPFPYDGGSFSKVDSFPWIELHEQPEGVG